MKYRFIRTLILPALMVALQVTPPAHSATTEENPVAVERTGVDLKLVGTAVVNLSEENLAVIEIGNSYQVYLREGDLIGSVLIKRILYDRVIVDAGNGEEIVKLRQSLSDGTIIQPELIHSPTPAQSFGPRPPEDRNFQAVYLDRETAKTVFADMDAVLKYVRIDPVSVYGQSTGIRVSPIAPGSVFAEIGLKTGDVVREVNGKAVFIPEEAVALFQEIKSGGEFDIKVKGRRTRQIHLTVE